MAQLTGALEAAFNDQVTLELEASLVYRQLAIEMDMLDLPGMASWFRAQADEEVVHANRFIDHMTDRDAHPRIQAVPAVAATAGTVQEAFEASLAHEQKVSESIRNLYRLAQQEGDIDALPLLNSFIDEQLEEEATVSELIGKIRLIGDDGPGLLKLDEQLGARQSGGTEAAE
ncbi:MULTISPECIES: ferritin [Actinomycetes]|uniref:Ferritin n=2 Tax=Actinomycetes TaxID=1760 RepID=A0ABP6M553_9MICC|nr:MULTISPECIES: ferritin [unclassified Nesterenkonia]MDS2173226.1 ferritin [Nesterenkonia sp. CL21]OSM42930.1 ferritin [Nesterenkonia sp. PF2B19]